MKKNVSLVLLSTVVSFLALGFGKSYAAPQNAAGKQWQAGSIYKTDYIPGRVQYTVQVLENSQIQIDADPNRCALSRLGERTSLCTRMAISSSTKSLKPSPVSVPLGTEVFSVEDSDLEVVVAPDSVRLLVIKNDNVVDVHHLK